MQTSIHCCEPVLLTFWLVTLHPFNYGNGRLTWAITDMPLAQSAPQAIHLYAMSAELLDDHAGCDRIQKAN